VSNMSSGDNAGGDVNVIGGVELLEEAQAKETALRLSEHLHRAKKECTLLSYSSSYSSPSHLDGGGGGGGGGGLDNWLETTTFPL